MHSDNFRNVVIDLMVNKDDPKATKYREATTEYTRDSYMVKFYEQRLKKEYNQDYADKLKKLVNIDLPAHKTKLMLAQRALEPRLFAYMQELVKNPRNFLFLKENADKIGREIFYDEATLRLLASHDFDELCFNEHNAEQVVIANNFGLTKCHSLYFDDYFRLLDIVKNNGIIGLNKLKKLEAANQDTDFAPFMYRVSECVKNLNKDDSVTNTLLIEFTKKNGLFELVSDRSIAILVQNNYNFVDELENTNKEIACVKTKKFIRENLLFAYSNK